MMTMIVLDERKNIKERERSLEFRKNGKLSSSGVFRLTVILLLKNKVSGDRH
jgi:hypothetical protein